MINILHLFFLKLKFRKKIKIGKNIKLSIFVKINITEQGLLVIEDNSIIKSDVEIRVHKNAKVFLNKNIKLDNGVRIIASNNATVNIGDRTKIGYFTVINAGDSLSIGRNCLISGFVYLQTSMHKHRQGMNIQDQGFDHSPIIMGDDVWLGTHVVIMPGIKILNGSIVGSNSVVTKNIDKNTIVAGIPATYLKTRT
ncbi:MAG: Unknown protein [uncultured Sulfurovum sp.]|uniref:Acyltransferase n=1 Tax=uncultured Sulfurovum sp. TaxID=269237 RepID=A0A6S6SSV2_9BACT|nr:MAG: Unknown protein [uncultured Sulfurovum sp.]